MDDYISRKALIGKMEKDYCAPCKGLDGDLGGDWCRFCAINGILEKVRGIPAADVEPVRRIHWTPYADGQTDTSGFITDDDYLLRTSTGYIVPGYWDDHFKEWTVPIEYDAAKDWADKFGQIVGFMKIQRPEDPA